MHFKVKCIPTKQHTINWYLFQTTCNKCHLLSADSVIELFLASSDVLPLCKLFSLKRVVYLLFACWEIVMFEIGPI